MIKRYYCVECGGVEVVEHNETPKDDFVKCSKCGDWAGDTEKFLTPEDIGGAPLSLTENNPIITLGPADEETL